MHIFDNTKHLNQARLSRRMGVAVQTLQRWRWAGIGPRFIKVGRSVRYRLEDIEAYEQSRLCQATSDRFYFDPVQPIDRSSSMITQESMTEPSDIHAGI